MDTNNLRKLNLFIDDIIDTYQERVQQTVSVNDLSDSDKQGIVGMLIHVGLIEEWDWLYESDDKPQFTKLFTNILINGDRDDREELINQMTQSVCKYHENKIQEIIDDRIEERYSRFIDELESNGFRRVVCKTNGEVTWTR